MGETGGLFIFIVYERLCCTGVGIRKGKEGKAVSVVESEGTWGSDRSQEASQRFKRRQDPQDVVQTPPLQIHPLPPYAHLPRLFFSPFALSPFFSRLYLDVSHSQQIFTLVAPGLSSDRRHRSPHTCSEQIGRLISSTRYQLDN